MAFDKAALLKKIAGAKESKGGDYLKAGIYGALEIVLLQIDKKRKGNMFIAEFIVRESKPNGDVGKDGKALLPHGPGSKPAYVVNLDDADGLGAGNVKSFLAALDGVSADDLTEAQFFELAEGYTADDQPARGMLIADNSFLKDTKKGQPFTHHRWEHVEQDAKDVAARRAAQEKKEKAA